MKKLLLFCLLLLTACGFAQEFKPGQFLYTWPEGYMPPRVSKTDLEELESFLDRQKYPMYVVLADEFEAWTRASEYGNSLLDTWSKESKGFEPKKSSMYLVSFEGDRQYRLFPAPAWRSLGLEDNALDQFNNIFLSHAKRGNPLKGITDTITSFNDHIFQLTDPETIRKRELNEIRETLQGTVNSINDNLKEKLKPKTSPETWEKNLAEATNLLTNKSEDIVALQVINSLLQPTKVDLEDQYKEKFLNRILKIITIIVSFILTFAGTFRFLNFLNMNLAAKDDTRGQIRYWSNQLSNAYSKLYLLSEDKEKYAYLKKFSGATSEQYKTISSKIDNMVMLLSAFSAKLEEVRKAEPTIFSRKKLNLWDVSLHQSFNYSTGEISTKLFEPIEKQITVTTEDVANLETNYDELLNDWNILLMSVQTVGRNPPRVAFSSDTLDRLLKTGINVRWLSDHPLMGTPEEDQEFYDNLEQLGLADPLAYAKRIDELKQQESELEARVEIILSSISTLEHIEKNLSTNIEFKQNGKDIVLEPAEDPKILKENILNKISVARNYLTLPGSTPNYQKCLDAIDNISSLNEDYHSLVRSIEDSISNIALKLTNVNKQIGIIVEKYNEVKAKFQNHSKELVLKTNLNHIKESLEKCYKLHDKAARLTEDNRVLTAYQVASEAEALTNITLEYIKDANKEVEEAIIHKQAYETKLKKMKSQKSSADEELRKYNSNLTVTYQEPILGSGAIDYFNMLTLLRIQESEWANSVTQAKRSYEQEQARIKREERRAREEERRSSSSSDSGSSWGSSFSSGDSGGSWSSGGGDSGGSW